MHKYQGLIATTIVALSTGNAAAAPASKAESVVAASKKATGGAAWDALQGADEQGTRGDGIQPYRTWLNFRAYGMRSETRRGDAVMAQGFNGAAVWRRGPDGKVGAMTDAKARSEAILTAYISNNGYYFPQRFPAEFKYVRQAKGAGRSSDVLEITPAGSRAFEIWFDSRNKQVWRIVDRGDGPPVTVEAGDYRPVAGVMVPYLLTVTGPDGKQFDRVTVTSVKFGPVAAGIFDPPAN